MTHGNSDSVKCPKCRKGIDDPARDDLPSPAMTEFVRPCPHCNTLLRFWARWEITVDAEVDSKTV